MGNRSHAPNRILDELWHTFQTHGYILYWGCIEQGSVAFPVIGYNSRQESEPSMKEYGGIGPWIFIFMYYVSMIALPAKQREKWLREWKGRWLVSGTGRYSGWGGGVDYDAIKSLAFFFSYSILFNEGKIFTKIYTSFYSAEFSCVETRNDSKEIKKLAKGQSSQFLLGQSIISLETGRVALASVCIFTQRKSDSYL